MLKGNALSLSAISKARVGESFLPEVFYSFALLHHLKCDFQILSFPKILQTPSEVIPCILRFITSVVHRALGVYAREFIAIGRVQPCQNMSGVETILLTSSMVPRYEYLFR